MSNWHPKEADLSTYMHGRMEAAYQQRERPQCSRADFFDGYLAALRDLRSRSSFKPDRFEPDAAQSPATASAADGRVRGETRT